MKKNMLTVLVLVLALSFSGVAFGAGWDTDYASNTGTATISDTGGGPDLDLKLSPNVGLDYAGSATGYNLTTFNQQGTRVYGATENFEGLFVSVNDYTPTDALAVPAAANAFDSTNWSVVGGGTFPSGL